MIPGLTSAGILPPFLPQYSPAQPAARAPYSATLLEVAQQFGHTAARRQILFGLLNYRAQLRQLGAQIGFQWINGSFLEDVENIRSRPPGDIDIVTFGVLPVQSTQDKQNFLNNNLNLFDNNLTKQHFYCDAFFVDLTTHPFFLVNQSTYWYGLFSHQKLTFAWKGLIVIDESISDSDVYNWLNSQKL